MRARPSLLLLLLGAFALALGVSCSDDTTGPQTSEELEGYLMGIPTYPDPPESNDGSHKVMDEATTESTTSEGRFLCTTTDYRMDKNLHEIAVFNPNALSLWPGAVVQGKDVDNGVLNLIALPRAPIRVGTDLTGLSAEENSRVIANPDQLTVKGAISEIVTTFLDRNNAIPAKLAYSETFAETFQQAMLDLDVAVAWSGWNSGSVQTSFAASSETYTSSYYCRFSQTYFTASALPPAHCNEFFSTDVGPEDCAAYMEAGNPPCWLSAVVYGRIGILAVHSSYSKRDVQLAVQAAFSSMGWDLDSDLNSYYQEVLANSELKLLILGGNATDGVQAIMGDPIAGLRQWIENGAEMSATSQGAPISWTANYVRDNRMAAFAYATEWTVEECVPVGRRFHFEVTELQCTASDDGLFDSELEVYYTFRVHRRLPGEETWTMVHEWARPPSAALNMSTGDRAYPDCKFDFDMPDLQGAAYRFRFSLAEDDVLSDDAIGDYYTGDYAYPLWRESNGDCSYPADWGTPGGEAAPCYESLYNSGMGIIVRWAVSELPLEP